MNKSLVQQQFGAHAAAYDSIDIELGTELIGFDQSPDHVTLHLRDDRNATPPTERGTSRAARWRDGGMWRLHALGICQLGQSPDFGSSDAGQAR